tara:strand:+ start:198 stop:629 length:432 start_codon:yes stop_codon:yes gene_type:complete
MKISEEELRQIILEEIEDMDEGVLDKLKAVGGGIGSALTTPLGGMGIGQGYQRGKAASIMKSASKDLNKVRAELVKNFEGSFKDFFTAKTKVDASMEDVMSKLKQALATIDQASNTLMSLSEDVKNTATRKPMKRSSLEYETD